MRLGQQCVLSPAQTNSFGLVALSLGSSLRHALKPLLKRLLILIGAKLFGLIDELLRLRLFGTL